MQKTCGIVQISVKYTKFGRGIKVNTLSKSGDERSMNSNFGLLRTAPYRTASIRLIQVFFKDSGVAQSSRLLEVCYR